MFGASKNRLMAIEDDRDNLDAIVRTQRAIIERLKEELDSVKAGETKWRQAADLQTQISARVAYDIRETLRKAAIDAIPRVEEPKSAPTGPCRIEIIR